MAIVYIVSAICSTDEELVILVWTQVNSTTAILYILHSQVPVALKTLHGEHINTGEAEFQREAEVMMGLDHLCIVTLYGICRGESLMMVNSNYICHMLSYYL